MLGSAIWGNTPDECDRDAEVFYRFGAALYANENKYETGVATGGMVCKKREREDVQRPIRTVILFA